MPANVVKAANSRKHLKPEEKKAREAAEAQLEREKVRLQVPALVAGDKRALAYWNKAVKAMKGITLLDDLDVDMLASYCMMSSRWERLQELINKKFDDGEYDDRLFARVEAAEKNRLAYAEKLGLTPSSRARLAKRRAEKKPTDPAADLYGD